MLPKFMSLMLLALLLSACTPYTSIALKSYCTLPMEQRSAVRFGSDLATSGVRLRIHCPGDPEDEFTELHPLENHYDAQ